jgi:UDP-N-acetylglucosamine--N-acetylmuramyl-(pentapeptide) pyrophosphoryl-undecaprenol N-acetylglucosamine transferase
MAYKLKENEEENPQSRISVDYDIHLTPEGNIEDAISALKNIDNYGIYISNMRNKSNVEKAIQVYFGNMDEKGNKISPAKKSSIEKQRGEKFPVKTKQAIDDFVKSLTSTPTLLSYDVKGKEIVFPKSNNPSKDLTKKIIKIVMDNAGIKFKLSDKEAVSEIKITKSKLTEIIKNFNFRLLSGTNLYDETKQKTKNPVDIISYSQDMKTHYEWANLVIARAGAGVISECVLHALPVILIPYPYAADNHQAENAKFCEDNYGFKVLYQKDEDNTEVLKILLEFISDKNKLSELSIKSLEGARPNATKDTVDFFFATSNTKL